MKPLTLLFVTLLIVCLCACEKSNPIQPIAQLTSEQQLLASKNLSQSQQDFIYSWYVAHENVLTCMVDAPSGDVHYNSSFMFGIAPANRGFIWSTTVMGPDGFINGVLGRDTVRANTMYIDSIYVIRTVKVVSDTVSDTTRTAYYRFSYIVVNYK